MSAIILSPGEGAGRVEILNWINSLLSLNYTKIEQLANGAAYCQIIDSIYGKLITSNQQLSLLPSGDLQLAKVKFNTVLEYEMVSNYKVLQSAFSRHGIEQAIPVDRLIKGKFQDNLEFSQWMKKFWDARCMDCGSSYNAVARRKGATSTISSSFAAASAPVPSKSNNNSNQSRQQPHNANASTIAPAVKKVSSSSHQQPQSTPKQSLVASAESQEHEQMISNLNSQLTASKLVIDSLERERDFYFGKLRDVEVLCQDTQEDPETTKIEPFSGFIAKVLHILYKTDASEDKNTTTLKTNSNNNNNSCISPVKLKPCLSNEEEEGDTLNLSSFSPPPHLISNEQIKDEEEYF